MVEGGKKKDPFNREGFMRVRNQLGIRLRLGSLLLREVPEAAVLNCWLEFELFSDYYGQSCILVSRTM
ncbi:unnamed protein product [Lathyrus oleraceus]